MAKKTNKKTSSTPAKPKVHKELEGFEVSINSFGEIVSTKSIDEINAFLDRHMPGKKNRKARAQNKDKAN
ncbi:MAG: hypothetical protein RMJ44_03160 [Cytophagales bacterium]|nr:hypothetical protein [Bernardetiaceae bacterium]MDW8210062.1 hypothetical protein [Cytophagales bacterium]